MGLHVLLSLPCAVIPMIVFIYIVRKLDKYDPEPLWLLTFHFLWGAIIAVGFAALINTKLSVLFLGKGVTLDNATPDKRMMVLLVVACLGPIIEELLKASVFGITVGLRDFNNLTDGIVYGSAVGFGFGMTENLVYFMRGAGMEDWVQFVMYRTFFSAMMHAMTTSIFASFLGYGRFKYIDIPWRFAVMGIIPAIAVHIAWNYFILTPSARMFGFIVMTITFLGMCYAFYRSMSYEHIYIRQELQDEADKGVIPQSYVELPFRKHRSQQEYITALMCSRIAFERITNKQLKSPVQIDRSNKILEALRVQIQKMPQV